MKRFVHLNYNIDKEYWRDLFYERLNEGQWNDSCPRKKTLHWYQIFFHPGTELRKLVEPVERDLNIDGLDTFPRFSYMFPGAVLPIHKDEDGLIGININILDDVPAPVIHIKGQAFPYEAALIDVGNIQHSVKAVPHHRLILKFCLRYPYAEVYKRIESTGLICPTT